jgi:hypothetical protein
MSTKNTGRIPSMGYVFQLRVTKNKKKSPQLRIDSSHIKSSGIAWGQKTWQVKRSIHHVEVNISVIFSISYPNYSQIENIENLK